MFIEQLKSKCEQHSVKFLVGVESWHSYSKPLNGSEDVESNS